MKVITKKYHSQFSVCMHKRDHIRKKVSIKKKVIINKKSEKKSWHDKLLLVKASNASIVATEEKKVDLK